MELRGGRPDVPRAAVVVGTRSELARVTRVVRALGPRCYVVHSGQYEDETLAQALAAGQELPEPEVRLGGVGGASRGVQFSAVIGQLTVRFTEDRPGAVVVHGATTTAAAAAAAASFLDIPVVRVDEGGVGNAGPRAHDPRRTEETNRRLLAVLADVHCAPTEVAVARLRDQGVAEERILLTGGTVVESVLASLPGEAARGSLLEHNGLRADGYVLAAVLRAESTDDAARLTAILSSLAEIGLPVVLPLPPRALRQADRHGLRGLLDRLRPVELVDRPTFLALAREARLVVSDSGAVQEECAVLRRPLAALGSGERPELVAAGFTRPVAPDAGLALRLRELVADDTWPARLAHRASPYGDGTASEAIARHTHDLLGLGAALRSRLQPAPPARAASAAPDSVTPEE